MATRPRASAPRPSTPRYENGATGVASGIMAPRHRPECAVAVCWPWRALQLSGFLHGSAYMSAWHSLAAAAAAHMNSRIYTMTGSACFLSCCPADPHQRQAVPRLAAAVPRAARAVRRLPRRPGAARVQQRRRQRGRVRGGRGGRARMHEQVRGFGGQVVGMGAP